MFDSAALNLTLACVNRIPQKCQMSHLNDGQQMRWHQLLIDSGTLFTFLVNPTSTKWATGPICRERSSYRALWVLWAGDNEVWDGFLGIAELTWMPKELLLPSALLHSVSLWYLGDETECRVGTPYIDRNFINSLPKAKVDQSESGFLQKTHLGYVPGPQIFFGTIP